MRPPGPRCSGTAAHRYRAVGTRGRGGGRFGHAQQGIGPPPLTTRDRWEPGAAPGNGWYRFRCTVRSGLVPGVCSGVPAAPQPDQAGLEVGGLPSPNHSREGQLQMKRNARNWRGGHSGSGGRHGLPSSDSAGASASAELVAPVQPARATVTDGHGHARGQQRRRGPTAISTGPQPRRAAAPPRAPPAVVECRRPPRRPKPRSGHQRHACRVLRATRRDHGAAEGDRLHRAVHRVADAARLVRRPGIPTCPTPSRCRRPAGW